MRRARSSSTRTLYGATASGSTRARSMARGSSTCTRSIGRTCKRNCLHRPCSALQATVISFSSARPTASRVLRRVISDSRAKIKMKPRPQIVFISITLSLMLGAALCWPVPRSAAQSGVLVPSSLKDKPDESLLSLQVMNVDVLIDNQHATVRVLQIYDNHTAQTLEGKYLFALPPDASVSDFAVWDNDTRIPGVMMEKRRANAIYGEIKQQAVDAGLLQQDDEHEGQSAFSAKVFPINAYGTKRVEMEYTEMLPVESLTSHFTFPLKPSFGDPQHVGEFSLHIHVLGDYPTTVSDSSQTAYL